MGGDVELSGESVEFLPEGDPNWGPNVDRVFIGESWYGNAKVRTRLSTSFFLRSMLEATSKPFSAAFAGSYNGARAVRISVALSATATPREWERISRTRLIFALNILAPGCSGFAISWKEKNMPAEKTWKGPQWTCAGTASGEVAMMSGRDCMTSWTSLSAASTAISRDPDIRSSGAFLFPGGDPWLCAAAADGR